MTDLLSKAIILAATAHTGQTDKAGKPYLQHICTVIAGVDTEEEMVTAALHDIVEDTEATHEQIRKEFGDNIARRVACLTHKKGEPYDDYIGRIMESKVAMKVKLSDLRHNMDLSRLDREPTAKDLQRIQKYTKARDRLTMALLKD